MTDSPPLHSAPQTPFDARPTLKTIALATGLAIATVSRALKDAPDIGEETKRRVRKTAAELGYRPNRAGVRLRTGKTNVIALILATETDVMNHTSQLISSIALALRGSAYHLVVMPFFPDEDPLSPVRYVVETGSADGIIINQTQANDPRVAYMTERHFPFATHGRTDMGIEHPYFDYDNEAFGQIAARALANRGRKNLLMIAPPLDQAYSVHMIAGFRSAATALGLTHAVMEEVHSDSGSGPIDAAIQARIASGEQVDGIIAGSTTAAMAAVSGAEAAGRIIGKDFDLAAKEAIPILARFRRDCIVLHEDVGRAGTFLTSALLAAIEGNTGPMHQYLDRPTEQ